MTLRQSVQGTCRKLAQVALGIHANININLHA